MHPLFGIAIFILLFLLLIWGGNRLFRNIEKRIDGQFRKLAEELGLTLQKNTPPFPGRTWIAPSLEGEKPGYSVQIYMEETRAGDNRNQKTIIEFHLNREIVRDFKFCRKLPLTTLLKLPGNTVTNNAAFDRAFVLWSRPPGEVPFWLDEPMRTELMAARRNINTGLFTGKGKLVRFETPYFIFSDATRVGLVRIFRLLERISAAELSGHESQ